MLKTMAKTIIIKADQMSITENALNAQTALCHELQLHIVTITHLQTWQTKMRQ